MGFFFTVSFHSLGWFCTIWLYIGILHPLFITENFSLFMFLKITDDSLVPWKKISFWRYDSVLKIEWDILDLYWKWMFVNYGMKKCIHLKMYSSFDYLMDHLKTTYSPFSLAVLKKIHTLSLSGLHEESYMKLWFRIMPGLSLLQEFWLSFWVERFVHFCF